MVESKGAFCIAIRVQKMLEAAGYDIWSVSAKPHHRVTTALSIKMIFNDQQKQTQDLNIIFFNQGDDSTQLQCVDIIDNLQLKFVRKEVTSEQIDTIFTHTTSAPQFNQAVAQLIIEKIKSIISEKQKED